MADIHELAALYALDALDASEAAAFEAHLPACQECRDELERLSSGVDAIARASSEPAPETLREDVMAAIDQHPSAETGARRDQAPVTPIDRARRRRRLVVAAAVAAAAITAVVLVGVLNAPLEGVDAVLAAQDVRSLQRTETPVGPIEIVWSDERGQGVFIGTELPPVAAGEVYALWVIDDTGPVPAGLFNPDPDGRATVLVEGDVASGTSLGLTVEPAGGSPAPTGDVLVAEPLN